MLHPNMRRSGPQAKPWRPHCCRRPLEMALPLTKFLRPAVFFGNGLGDGVLALPALRALCSAFGGREVLLLQDSTNKFLFAELPSRKTHFMNLQLNTKRKGMDFDVREALDIVGTCDLLVSLAEWKSRSL